MENKFKKYFNIDKKTLKEVNKLILKRYYKKNFIEKLQLLKQLNTNLSKIYKVPRIPIKIVPYKLANKNKETKYILIGDSLSLTTFLAKFKKIMDTHDQNIDNNEVILKRDCFDWALSVLQSSAPELIDKLFETKGKLIEEEENLKDNIQLNINGGNIRWKEVSWFPS